MRLPLIIVLVIAAPLAVLTGALREPLPPSKDNNVSLLSRSRECFNCFYKWRASNKSGDRYGCVYLWGESFLSTGLEGMEDLT